MSEHLIQVYALIKKSSEYYRQQHTSGKHFPVRFLSDRAHPHIVSGNQNQYRVLDLDFFIQIDGRFIKL